MIKKKSKDFNLVDVITFDGCIKLLQPFLYNPKIEMYQSEIIKKTGVPKTRAITLLNLLVSNGLLADKVKAGGKFYFAVEGNPVLKQLKILITISKLYESTRDLSSQDVEIFLFGSAAKGEDTENSDIDLLIIAGGDRKMIHDLIDRMKNSFNREVNPVIYTPIEYANLHAKEKAFYDQIERNKIRVL